MEMIAVTLSVAYHGVVVLILWYATKTLTKFGLDRLRRNDQEEIKINRRTLAVWITVYMIVLSIGLLARAVWLTWLS